MKTNKLSLIAALALGGLLACTSLASAQDAKEGKKGGKRGPTAERQLEMMSEKLKLTDEQKPKVKAVLEERDKKMQEVPADERREKMPAIREATDKKLKEILTADQWTQYEKMREEMRQGGRPGGKKSEEQKKD